MAASWKVHTLESLKARCTEEGDCLLWDGYGQNNTPQVYDGSVGKMQPVRKLMAALAGMLITDKIKYYAVSCGCSACVEPLHILPQTEKQHAAAMAKLINHNAPTRIAKLQNSAYARSKRKVSDEVKAAILTDERSGPEIAKDHGISRSMVNKYKNGKARRMVSASENPWAGLMR